MDNRITTDEVSQQFAKAIKMLLDWVKQEKLSQSTGNVGKLANDKEPFDKKTSDREQLLKASEVATILQVSKSKAYMLMQRREIPTVRISRSVRVRRADLDAFIKQSKDR